jgi:hypothetical protein
VNRHLADSATPDFTPKAEADDLAAHKRKVAEPSMAAIDAMPKVYRELVHAYGYVDVYRAWKRQMSPESIRAKAEANGGRFEL